MSIYDFRYIWFNIEFYVNFRIQYCVRVYYLLNRCFQFNGYRSYYCKLGYLKY